jgi:hypothetical protein
LARALGVKGGPRLNLIWKLASASSRGERALDDEGANEGENNAIEDDDDDDDGGDDDEEEDDGDDNDGDDDDDDEDDEK